MTPANDGLEVVLELRKLHADMRMASMDFLPMIKKIGACKVFYKPVELDWPFKSNWERDRVERQLLHTVRSDTICSVIATWHRPPALRR